MASIIKYVHSIFRGNHNIKNLDLPVSVTVLIKIFR